MKSRRAGAWRRRAALRSARPDTPSPRARHGFLLFSTAVLPVGAAIFLTASALHAQRIPFEERTFSEQVLRAHGQPVIPIYEGWYENPDGTFDICFGYHNLNMEEPLQIPLGPRNSLEPDRFQGEQPTYFAPVPGMGEASQMESRFRRHYCVFTVTVPADFGRDGEVTWTLQRENGPPVTTPGTLNPSYVLDEPASDGRGEIAPVLRFSEGGTEFQGRGGFTGPERTIRVGEPLDLEVRIEDLAGEEEMWVGWIQYRGPGTARFQPAEQSVVLTDGTATATTTATFTEPGEYVLLVQSINSATASFEFHCCWTNGYVPVTVEP
ncbi:MAG: hypothetical protein R3223_06395 [Longimicrobiales bacterium]|nr:hypothetical protein [Longimicrobiales bacterium]